MPCQAPCRHSPHLQQCRSHGSIQGWEASAHHQAEPCQGQVLPWDEPGRSWSSSRSLRDGAEPPAGLGISTGSRDGFQSAPSSRHLPHGEGSGAVPAPRGAQKQGISVNVARHLPGSTTPGSRAARLSESSIKDKNSFKSRKPIFPKHQDPSRIPLPSWGSLWIIYRVQPSNPAFPKWPWRTEQAPRGLQAQPGLAIFLSTFPSRPSAVHEDMEIRTAPLSNTEQPHTPDFPALPPLSAALAPRP